MALAQFRSKAAPKPCLMSKSKVSKDKTQMHRRSRTGCYTCRLRRKKCDESSPTCTACKNLGLTCNYKRPIWWSNNEERRIQKETIKTVIKRKKLIERGTLNPNKDMTSEAPLDLSRSMPMAMDYSDLEFRGRSTSVDSQPSSIELVTPPPSDDCCYFYNSSIYCNQPEYTSIFPEHASLDDELETELVNFAQIRPYATESDITGFTSMQPDLFGEQVLQFKNEVEWEYSNIKLTPEIFKQETESLFDMSSNACRSSVHANELPATDKYLLDYFISSVLPSVFPILETNSQKSMLINHVTSALQSNKCYMHCCLGIAAQHLKATLKTQNDRIDDDIIRYRVATISELREALDRDTDHASILEATLGMIVFQGCIGRVGDSLPDISWSNHFQAAISLVQKLEVDRLVAEKPFGHCSTLNMTITAWIDILGATMLGRAPFFAQTYHEKHLSNINTSLGLRELMGCDDHVLYLISEIACLETLKREGMDDIQLCRHVQSLGEQISATESNYDAGTHFNDTPDRLESEQLTCNIAAAFRIAARIYLCSLVPGFKISQASCVGLVNKLAHILRYIPSGPTGFDCSLVWVYLIAGSVAMSESPFRAEFIQRLRSLGDLASFGSMNRVTCVLREVWRRIDDNMNHESCEIELISWRDVMQEKSWDFLLI